MVWVVAFTCMLCGGFTYVLWRPTSLWMFSWFNDLGIGHGVALLRLWAEPFSHVFPAWVYWSLPQALWVFSGAVAILTLWKNFYSWSAQLWLLAVLTLGVSGEVGQAIGLVPGTYDPNDLLLVFLALGCAEMLGAVLYNKQVRGQIHEASQGTTSHYVCAGSGHHDSARGR